MVKLTRRQWLALPLDTKTRVGAVPAVIARNPDGSIRQELPVTWVTRAEDSDLKAGVDTAVNGQ